MPFIHGLSDIKEHFDVGGGLLVRSRNGQHESGSPAGSGILGSDA
jgi:hypothetical protein